MTPTTTRTERQRRVETARHSGLMERVDITPAMQADAADYIAGDLSLAELLTRTRARYGLP